MIENIENKELYISYLKDNLSQKRFKHSMNVADEAVKLSEQYGCDKEKAYIAGLMHDVCKEMPQEEQKKLVMKSNRNVSEAEKSAPPVWHGIAGAEFLPERFNITDDDILNSIRYHTVGRADMTILEQIIYLADLISAERDYADVKKMRKYCYQSLTKGMYEAMKFSIVSSVQKGNIIPPCTFECYNQFAKLNK